MGCSQRQGSHRSARNHGSQLGSFGFTIGVAKASTLAYRHVHVSSTQGVVAVKRGLLALVRLLRLVRGTSPFPLPRCALFNSGAELFIVFHSVGLLKALSSRSTASSVSVVFWTLARCCSSSVVSVRLRAISSERCE